MSEVDREQIAVSNDGLTVRKSLDDDQFETLAIVFDVGSDRDTPVRLRLVDHIPDTIKLDDIGFHPDFGAEYWVTEEEQVVFERDCAPGEEFTTIYGVREYTESDLDSFLRDPELELLDPDGSPSDQADAPSNNGSDSESEDIDDIVSAEDNQAVRDVIAGERDTLPGMEDADDDHGEEVADELLTADAPMTDGDTLLDIDTELDQATDPLDGNDDLDSTSDAPMTDDTEPMTDVEPPAGEPLSDDDTSLLGTGGDAADEPRDKITVPLTGGVVRVLAKELQAGTVDPEDKRLLREELLAGEESTDARIKHLQNEVSDLVAYTDALEAFIDENGSGQQLLDDLNDQMDHVAESFDEIETKLDRTASTVASLEDAVEALESDVDALREERATVDQLETTIQPLETGLDDVRDQIETLMSFRDRLSSAFGGQMGEE